MTLVSVTSITMIIIWVVVFIVALGVELGTAQLVSIWACGGAVVALILAICNVPYYWQIGAFAVVTGILLLLCKLLYHPKKDDSKTNSDALIGQEIEITEDVSKNHDGTGKIRDVIWTVKVEDDITIKKGDFAVITSIKGSHLVVSLK